MVGSPSFYVLPDAEYVLGRSTSPSRLSDCSSRRWTRDRSVLRDLEMGFWLGSRSAIKFHF